MNYFVLFYLWARFIRTRSEILSRIFNDACEFGGDNSLVLRRESLFGPKNTIIHVPNDKFIFEKFRRNGYFSLPMSAFLSQGFDDDCKTILDLGAHAGLVSLQAIRLSQRVDLEIVAVEPIPDHYKCLQENFRELNLKLFASGFANNDEDFITIYIDKDNLGNSSALQSIAAKDAPTEENIIVPTVALSEVFRSIGESNFILKSDLQGLDLHVLSFAPKSFWLQINRGVIEVNAHSEIDSIECVTMLEQLDELFHLSWGVFPFRKITKFSVEDFWLGGSCEERDLFFVAKER
jgi:FkbM family methyltransferase